MTPMFFVYFVLFILWIAFLLALAAMVLLHLRRRIGEAMDQVREVATR